MIEIGPGRGALTEHLAPLAERLVLIELDQPLIAPLRDRFPAAQVVAGDVLATDLAQWGPAAVVGNLPYYITSPIIERILAAGPACRWAVLMMQKEVAERVCARPGSRDYGYLSVATQSQAEVEYLFTVPPGAFQPPPKVDSAVIKMTPRAERPLPEFLSFAAAAFRQKRKTLRNNLLASYPAIADAPESQLRGEQLSVTELMALFERLTGKSS